ncbi:complex I 51 kDa subunit family protein [Clostridium intestinale]|uniref:complex I 51 kDa subunit family protein n=1 Tax=Clostridium intestinale TaxID=36845 RepID=UPI002DD649BF|nr:NADH-ubiquinone oxidoreductase-F iron-sulfur binding region domain-containing protein [Clostridium intestinale]WRY51352.1 NADH-ubiquinone oxidoreductase-F iron-sulfur binding region domain-containing protein [Clostridium intestinale]
MKKSVEIISKNFNFKNPESLEEYIKSGGFSALKQVIDMPKEEIFDVVTASKLKGRGGAAYPTGRKLQQAAQEIADSKVIVCNADEGEPSTFKDRALLEWAPFKVLEGLIISAYAINADRGYIYIREEYQKLQRRMRTAIELAEKENLLGENILGKGFNLKVEVVSGGGAYVCGEGSALAESIEGKSGRPRIKPPYIKQKGVFGLPTCINNVETLAIVPVLFSKDAEEYLSCGTEESKGTKLISISGNVNRPGVYEIPFGLTLREIIYDVAKGIENDKKFKFLQLGGASGPIASDMMLDVKYTYEDFKANGLAIGSGAILVGDESNSIVDYVRTVQDFFVHESCGKCTPCREGNKQLAVIIKRFSNKIAGPEDLASINKITDIMKSASFCGLGKSCTAPLISAIREFKEEFYSCM